MIGSAYHSVMKCFHICIDSVNSFQDGLFFQCQCLHDVNTTRRQLYIVLIVNIKLKI